MFVANQSPSLFSCSSVWVPKQDHKNMTRLEERGRPPTPTPTPTSNLVSFQHIIFDPFHYTYTPMKYWDAADNHVERIVPVLEWFWFYCVNVHTILSV